MKKEYLYLAAALIGLSATVHLHAEKDKIAESVENYNFSWEKEGSYSRGPKKGAGKSAAGKQLASDESDSDFGQMVEESGYDEDIDGPQKVESDDEPQKAKSGEDFASKAMQRARSQNAGEKKSGRMDNMQEKINEAHRLALKEQRKFNEEQQEANDALASAEKAYTKFIDTLIDGFERGGFNVKGDKGKELKNKASDLADKKAALGKMYSTRSTMQKRIGESRRENNRLGEEVAALEEKQLRQEIEGVANVQDNTAVAKLTAEQASLIELCKELSASLEKLHSQKSKTKSSKTQNLIEKKMQEQQEKLEAKKRDLEVVEQDLAHAQDLAKSSSDETKDFASSITLKNRQIAKNQRTIATLEEKINQLDPQIEALRSETDELSNTLRAELLTEAKSIMAKAADKGDEVAKRALADIEKKSDTLSSKKSASRKHSKKDS